MMKKLFCHFSQELLRFHLYLSINICVYKFHCDIFPELFRNSRSSPQILWRLETSHARKLRARSLNHRVQTLQKKKKKPRYPASLRKLVPTFKHKHRASPPPPKEEKKRGPAFTRPKPPLKTISLRWSVLKWTFSRSGWNGVGTRPSSSSLLPLPPPPRPFSFLIRGHLSFPRYTVWLLRSTFQNLPSSGVGTKSARFCFGLLHRAAAVFRRLTLCECCSPRRCAQPSYPRISALVFDERGDERVAREIRLMERGERIPGAFVISLLDRARVELPTRVFPRGRVIHWRRSFVSFRREPPLNRD